MQTNKTLDESDAIMQLIAVNDSHKMLVLVIINRKERTFIQVVNHPKR